MQRKVKPQENRPVQSGRFLACEPAFPHGAKLPGHDGGQPHAVCLHEECISCCSNVLSIISYRAAPGSLCSVTGQRY